MFRLVAKDEMKRNKVKLTVVSLSDYKVRMQIMDDGPWLILFHCLIPISFSPIWGAFDGTNLLDYKLTILSLQILF